MIYGLNGNLLPSLDVEVPTAFVKTISVLVDCDNGCRLYSEDNSEGVIMQAKPSESDTFQDITDTPLDLSDYSGLHQFDIEITIPSAYNNIPISVGKLYVEKK